MMRDRLSDTAFELCLKMVGGYNKISENQADKIWNFCRDDESVRSAVSLFLYCESSYKPKAMYALHTKLVWVLGASGVKPQPEYLGK